MKRLPPPPARTPPNSALVVQPKRAAVLSNTVATVARGRRAARKPHTAEGPQGIYSYRILALLLSQIRPTRDLDFAEFRVHKNVLWRAIGYSPNRRPSLAEAEQVITDLAGGVFTVRADYKFRALPYMAACEIDTTTGECLLRLNREVAPYLLLEEARNYRKIHFRAVCSLRSVHAVLLYLFARRYAGRQFVGGDHDRFHLISVRDLRMALQVGGRYYDQWAKLDRDVLAPAVAEINQQTELRIRYEPCRPASANKRGAVESVRFDISEDEDALEELKRAPEPETQPVRRVRLKEHVPTEDWPPAVQRDDDREDPYADIH